MNTEPSEKPNDTTSGKNSSDAGKADRPKIWGETALKWFELLGVKIAVPLVLLGLGFSLKGSVEQAFRRQELEVKSAESIEKLLGTLHKSNVSRVDASAAALTMASYGQAAIIPLIGVLEYGPSEAQQAARQSLFIIGLVHPEELASDLAKILERRNGQLSWSTHKAAIELLGQLQNPACIEPLQKYCRLLARTDRVGLEQWQRAVRGPRMGDYKATRTSLIDALNAYHIRWQPDTTKEVSP